MAYASLEEALTIGVGIERQFPCPVHDDTNPSASINSITGFWCCYTCGAWGKTDLSRMEIDPHQAMITLKRLFDKLNPVHLHYPEGWLSVHDSSGPGDYWLSRFTPETCRHFRLGQTPDRDFATIPMRDNSGRVLGIIRRDLTGGKQKYRYPKGVDVTKHLFDYHRIGSDHLILTEGATDAIAVWEAGFNNAMALYGSRISREQVALIRKHHPTKILTCQDQDAAGHGAHERVVQALGRDFVVQRVEWDTYKDLASIPLVERRNMLSEILQERPRFALANREQTRVGSQACGSSRHESETTSSSGTRKLVVPRKTPSGVGLSLKRS